MDTYSAVHWVAHLVVAMDTLSATSDTKIREGLNVWTCVYVIE